MGFQEITSNIRAFNLDDMVLYIREVAPGIYDEYIVFTETAHRDIIEPKYMTRKQIEEEYGIKILK